MLWILNGTRTAVVNVFVLWLFLLAACFLLFAVIIHAIVLGYLSDITLR